MEGKVVRSDDPRIDRLIPAHINCACRWVEIGDREGGKQDWLDWDDEEFQELLDTHAHFHGSRKYEALRVPASPSGRDFVFRRGKAGEPGTREWKRPRYEERDDLVEAGVEEKGERWRPLGSDDPGAGPGTPPAPRGPVGPWPRPASQADSDPSSERPRFEQDDERYHLPEIDRRMPESLAKLDSVDDIQAWAKERWPKTEFSLRGAQPETVKPLLAELERLEEEWPGTVAHLKRVHIDRNLSGGARIAHSQSGELALNPDYFGDWEYYRFRKVRLVEEGYYHSGAGSFAETMAHEFGHQWSYAMMAGEDEDAKDQLNKWMRKHRDADWSHNVKTDRTANEALAEAFAMRYHEANEASHPAVQEFWSIMDKLRGRGL